MSESGPDDPAPDPFRGIPLFGDLAKLVAQQVGAGWDAAAQLAVMVASDGVAEANVDPLDRIAFEQLTRVAELHIAEITGLTPPTGPAGSIEVVTRSAWAARTLEDHRRLLDALAASLTAPADDEDLSAAADAADPMAPLLRLLGPALLAMTAGSMVGHLAQRSFGSYDLPLPRPAGRGVMVTPVNLRSFSDDWSLDIDSLRLWVCVHELTWHTLLAVSTIRSRYDDLLDGWLRSFDRSGGELGERLAGLDLAMLGDESGLGEALADPEILLGAIRSPAQDAIAVELDALVAVLVGYVDHVVDQVGKRLAPSWGMVSEAMRRRRVEAGPGDRLVERLFGLELSTAQVERGRSFVAGVIDRAGHDGLRRLFDTVTSFPTPPEVDAPGLWLARLELGLEPGAGPDSAAT